MKSIVVVDNDASVRKILIDYLSQNEFHIDAFENGQQMISHLRARPADLAIVDINQTEADGLQITQDLSRKLEIPVIVMSGDRLDEDDKVEAFELGATDYIAKPFGLREFLARVQNALRERPERRAHRQVHRVYTFDGWRLNSRYRRLSDATGTEVKLTASEFNILMAFVQFPRQVVSREQILAATRIYDEEIFDRSIDVLILRLRRKIEKDPSHPRYVKTSRRAGYVFDVDVEIEDLRQRHS